MKKLIILIFITFQISFIYAYDGFIDVSVILAQRDNHGIDSRIKFLHEKLSSILNYHSYRLISKDSIEVKIKETKLLSIPEKGSLILQPIIYENNYLAIKIEVKGQRSFTAVVKISKKSGIIIRGPTTVEGDILIYIAL